MRIGGEGKKIDREGRSVFTYYYSRYKKYCIVQGDMEFIPYLDSNKFSMTKHAEKISAYHDVYFRGRSGNFSHYFRFLYNMFKFISDANINDEEKKKYANILRAQISNYELLILFYNGNARHGVKFKEYFNKYSLFDNLPVDKLISDVHVLLHDQVAWGDNADAISKIKEATEKGLK